MDEEMHIFCLVFDVTSAILSSHAGRSDRASSRIDGSLEGLRKSGKPGLPRLRYSQSLDGSSAGLARAGSRSSSAQEEACLS